MAPAPTVRSAPLGCTFAVLLVTDSTTSGISPPGSSLRSTLLTIET
ncbi:MAG: hypothetical protein GX442_20235 [Candidatus Riflebacteria bacterium]|nr:hypothetical protein [Candidatus Riflebacteria bacterium]